MAPLEPEALKTVTETSTVMIDGEQYIAVNAGWGGGMAMAELRGGRDMHRSTARVLAFKIGGNAQLPPVPPQCLAG